MLSFLDVARWRKPDEQDPQAHKVAAAGEPPSGPDRDPSVAPASRRAPHITFAPGMVLGAGRFALKKLIASGGFGLLFEGQDSLLSRGVAIKVLHPYLNQNTEVVGRFMREARALASVQHPNIVAVLEMGRHVESGESGPRTEPDQAVHQDGAHFIVQELLNGINLRDHLSIVQGVQDRQGLSPREALSIMLPIISGLVAVHKHGIVHRDIKPENIVITRLVSGEIVPKLVDFGIAKMYIKDEPFTRGPGLGTPWYMSPEQVRDPSKADERTDVWAIAAVIYELLSGKMLYEEDDPHQVLNRIIETRQRHIARELPDVDRGLASILQEALDPEHSRRTPSMEVLRAKLVAWIGREPVVWWFATMPRDGDGPPSTRRRSPGASLPPPSLPPPPEPRTHDEHEKAKLISVPRVAADAAKSAFDTNALTLAVELARQAVAASHDEHPVLRAKMWLIQGISWRWLGDYAEAERCLLEALSLSRRASKRWFAAVGYLIIVRGYLGKTDHLQDVTDELLAIDHREVSGAEYLVALCRLVVFSARAGMAGAASSALARAVQTASDREVSDEISRAWLDVAHAEVALRNGDLATHYNFVLSAAEGFARGGDPRNAYLQQGNVANALMRLGDYESAVVVLRNVLEIAQPMQVDYVAPVWTNLGLALGRAGDVDEALTVAWQAIELCDQQSHLRFQCVARLYLAEIMLIRRDLAGAEAALQQALGMSEDMDDIRVHALAIRADVLLQQRQWARALELARSAKSLLEELGSVEEGELRVRVVYAQALRATGDDAGAVAELRSARRRLSLRAQSISHPSQRDSFLRRVADNAAVMQLAAAWGV